MKPVAGSVYECANGKRVLLHNGKDGEKKRQLADSKVKGGVRYQTDVSGYDQDGIPNWRVTAVQQHKLVKRICTRDAWQRDRSKEKRREAVKVELVEPKKRHVFEETGENRSPRKGEWFQLPNGTVLESMFDCHGQKYTILKKVE